MRLLALVNRPIESAHIGYDLRVANLCAQLPGEVHLLVAPLCESANPSPTISAASIFSSVELLPPLLAGRQSPRRHLRLSDDHFLERAVPTALAAARNRVHEVVREKAITHIVVFGGDLAELVTGVDPEAMVLDVCDSRSLTAERELRWSASPSTGLRSLGDRLALRRLRATEARFPAKFRHVTTISEPDRRAIAMLHGAARNVHTIPNGVGEAYTGPLGAAGKRRGVAFWGNLAFAPNVEALRYFVQDVYLPVLRDEGVELCIVGADRPSWLAELADRELLVKTPGFVEDLGAVVTRYPIMINPMRTGSGLKNKVLEAFGLGLAVVSTPLGVEALPSAQDGTHFVAASDAPAFSAAVLDLLADGQRVDRLRRGAYRLLHEEYRWDVIGSAWRSLLRSDNPAVTAPTYRTEE